MSTNPRFSELGIIVVTSELCAPGVQFDRARGSPAGFVIVRAGLLYFGLELVLTVFLAFGLCGVGVWPIVLRLVLFSNRLCDLRVLVVATQLHAPRIVVVHLGFFGLGFLVVPEMCWPFWVLLVTALVYAFGLHLLGVFECADGILFVSIRFHQHGFVAAVTEFCSPRIALISS